ncbi:ESX secretion-associated protein EspG [Rhodococcus tibetensis]|uniref:ESX secretion-associated protein EspG n=1 Tax=Rhodococcus tibetensis TaxID=2965064 RepID=A0ABT1Q5T1_9NOCA|nr:ESX secretion-associated protein EspG [Rhodococcus sp. FXJ9.536]MCQ4117604.1 ESX secretion-associated protein EspG [Rhodococcus sp. FXJ9.536]
MSMRNWRLRPELFDALWTGTGQDRMPYPFRVVSTHAGLNAYAAEQTSIREVFSGAEHDNLRSALDVLAEPELYAEISGSTTGDMPMRIIGAQREQWSVIATQLPGRSPQIGGDVVLGAGPSGQLGAQLIALIPPNAAGRTHFRRRDAEESEYAGGILRDVNAAAPAPRLETAVQRGYAGRGKIRVFRGPRYGSGRDVGAINWIDIAGDGRYAIGPHDPRAANPAGPRELVAALDTLISVGTTQRAGSVAARGW